MKFTKYQGLGNDYLVIEPEELPGLPTADQVRRICDRHYGVGSDGILIGPLPSKTADFGIRIFNTDGSEAEKSGNGLRIFAYHLWEADRVDTYPTWLSVETPGGIVRCQVHAGGGAVTVEMGRVSFTSRDIPVAGAPREVLNERIQVGGEELVFCAASLGNPHCVVLCQQVSPQLARRLGPLIEHAAEFPRRTNVQFMQVLDGENIRIEIWERGAGYTLASGSSSCAAAAVAHRLGLCGQKVAVHMPGGQLSVALSPDWNASLSGPVQKVFAGSMSLDND